LKLTKDKLLKMHENMLKIRIFEEAAINLFKEGFIRGPLHVYIGEEAVAVGACINLKKDDYITSTHRGHGHCIAKGGNLKKMAAELLGKTTGYCKGKGGSMHITDIEIGMLGANGIVGGSIGMATGVALSAKMRKTDQITICFFGEGAANQGIFHESLNIAAIWNLPIIYICENNFYGLSSPFSKMTSIKNIADRAKSYGIYGDIVDGNDVLTVYEVVEAAMARIREGKGPTLIEAKTYRWEGHFVGDPCVYRTKDEVEEWKKKCPIKKFANILLEKEGIKQEELDEIKKVVIKNLDEAIKFAKKSPEPKISAVYEDIYKEL